MTRNIIITLLGIALSLSFAQADTIIPGGYVSGAWTTAGSPYLIEGEITVHADSSLAIQPGVEVNFQGHYKFIVEGILQAVGTEQDSILFTAAIPDTGWRGIRFETAPDGSQLSYCVLQYGLATVGTSFLDRRGGGIYSNLSRPEITHCTIRSCFADFGGGGIFISGALPPTFPPILDCTITGNSTNGNGGGIYKATTDSVSLSNCTITENLALGNGGGIYMTTSDIAIFSNCTISNNSAGIATNLQVKGGGIFFSGSHITISECTITGNESDDDGGGLYLESPLLITNSVVSDNTTTGVPILLSGEGAGIYTNYSVTMDSCTVSGNHSITRGSGIFAGGALNLTNSIFSGNITDDNAVIVFGNGGGSIENCVISDNQGIGLGGVYLFNANLVISGCSFTGNTVTWNGVGALRSTINSVVQLSHCTFSENFGGGYAGGIGGILVEASSQIDVDHCTFASNTAHSVGAIQVESDGNVNITNSIFWDNSPNAILRDGDGTINYSDFFGNGQDIAGNIPAGFGELTAVNANDDSCDVYNNIFLDPLFEDPASGNYQITWENFPIWDETRSPCIDAGDPLFALDPDTTITDMGALFFDQTIVGIEPNSNRRIPAEFRLDSPYPNPFNPLTTFKIELPVASWVTLEIFDVGGRSVGFVVDGWRSAAYHEVTFDGSGLVSGVYVYQIKVGDFNASGKMVLLK